MPDSSVSQNETSRRGWRVENRDGCLTVSFPDLGVRPATDMEVELQRRIDSLADFIEEHIEGSQVYRDIAMVVT